MHPFRGIEIVLLTTPLCFLKLSLPPLGDAHASFFFVQGCISIIVALFRVVYQLQWATKAVETLLGNDPFRYLSICSILFASSVNSLIPPAPQFNVV